MNQRERKVIKERERFSLPKSWTYVKSVDMNTFELVGNLVITAIGILANTSTYLLNVVINHFKPKEQPVQAKTLLTAEKVLTAPLNSKSNLSAKDRLRGLSKALDKTEKLPNSWFGLEEVIVDKQEAQSDQEFITDLLKDSKKSMNLREFFELVEKRKKHKK